MAEREAHQELPEEHPDRHEHVDVRFRPLVIVLVVFAIIGLVIHVGLYFLFGLYERTVSPEEMRRVSSAVRTARGIPPEPRLQGIPPLHENSPREDLREMLAEHRRQLETYAETTEEGFVRIPIERAMELLVEHASTNDDNPPQEDDG